MTRRDLLAVSTAMTFATSGAASCARAQSQAKRNFVLVHGAWHGGWCWKYVREALQAEGHTVFSPSLTGLGDRVHLRNPDVNLTTHVTDVVNLIEYEELEDVILVGHSYGGHVVAWAADKVKERLSHVAFLDAALPTDGEPFLAPGVGEGRIKDATDGYLMAVQSMEDFLGIPLDHPLHDWVARHLVEHPLPTLMETVVYENGGPAGLPKTFVRCTGNPRMQSGEADPVFAMTEADPEWSYVTIETGHDLMVTAPDETTDILLKIATG